MISDLPSFVVVSISLFSAVEIFEAVADVVVVETVEVSAPSAEWKAKSLNRLKWS